MPFKAGKPQRSPHDWLCRFCVTSSGNPYRNNGFRRECHRCHLAKGEAFKARSENREPPTKSTKESAKVAALEKELERYRQAEKKFDSAPQETDVPTRVQPYDHPAIQMVKAGLDSYRQLECSQNQIAMHEKDLKAANDRVLETEQSIFGRSAKLGAAPSQGLARTTESPGAAPSDKLQLKLRTDPRPLSCKSWSQMESTSTCPRRQRTASRKLQISMRRNVKQRQQQKEAASRPTKEAMELDEFGDLDDREDAAPETPLLRHDEMQAQTRGDAREAQMASGSQLAGAQRPSKGGTSRRRKSPL